jgi:hypothetical protein
VSVLGVEDLQLAPTVVQIEPPVGQDAVDVEEESFDGPPRP